MIMRATSFRNKTFRNDFNLESQTRQVAQLSQRPRCRVR